MQDIVSHIRINAPRALTKLRRAAVVRDAASKYNELCVLSLVGTDKPQTFLQSYTSFKTVQLFFLVRALTKSLQK